MVYDDELFEVYPNFIIHWTCILCRNRLFQERRKDKRTICGEQQSQNCGRANARGQSKV